MSKAIALTTSDNPFDPFTQWDDWRHWDEDNGYYTNSYLARISRTSIEMDEDDYDRAIEEAIDEICLLNITGNYKKVYEE